MTRGGKRSLWIASGFLLVSSLTRIGLAIYSGEAYSLGQWITFMSTGFVFDLVVVPCFLLPWALYDALLPRFITDHPILNKWEVRWAALWAVIFLSIFVFTAVSEFTFWAEFNTRFDFIAVDYLIYTHEVIGNIWQSYPVIPWLAGIFGFCIVAVWFTWPRLNNPARPRWAVRWGYAFLVAAVIPVGMEGLDVEFAENPSSTYIQQLSLNGPFAFGHAFRHNELDYDQYYPTLDQASLNGQIRTLIQEGNSQFVKELGIERKITPSHTLRDANVVLISVESLSASFMGIFGNDMNITPEMDRLAKQGLLFTNLYATGTRTVRGLEALSVGTPPTPGQSIVRRPNNNSLENLGEELKESGWFPYWIYGGYGFFDNMNAYFNANEYTVVDRSDIDAEGIPVHHETVWGVADEDLYSLALINMDREVAQGHRFFTHIMTTSNHRPYTYPEGRIEAVPGRRRETVVKYTDWAIGDFIRRSADKPWFRNTLFIITADHTAKAAGKTDLPPSRYHIPMIWYAPGMIQPGTMDRLMSQIDVAPSLLGWLGVEYSSRFFGYDIFNLEPGRERAFISTYQKLGYLKNDRLVVLDVNKDPKVLSGLPVKANNSMTNQSIVNEAIAWYQSASEYFHAGLLREKEDNDGG